MDPRPRASWYLPQLDVSSSSLEGGAFFRGNLPLPAVATAVATAEHALLFDSLIALKSHQSSCARTAPSPWVALHLGTLCEKQSSSLFGLVRDAHTQLVAGELHMPHHVYF